MENFRAIFEEDYVAPQERLEKKKLDIIDLIHEAERIDKVSRDWRVTADDIKVTDTLNMSIRGQSPIGEPFEELLAITPYSFSQMCNRLGFPPAYAKKLMKIGREDLLVHNLNELLRSQDEDRVFLLRQTGTHMRAFLSNKYSVVDSPAILKIAKEVIPMDRFEVLSYHISPERLHVRFIGDRLDIPDQDLFLGVQIDSSDVGRKNLSIDFFIYKQVCSNGLKVPKFSTNIYKKVHLGSAMSEIAFYRDFRNGMKVMLEYVEEVKKAILDAMNHKLTDEEFKKLFEKSKKSLPLIEEEADVQMFMRRYGATRFGYINALTDIAQRYTLDQRLEFEEFAGELLVA